jgi:hypothetical protein
MNCPVNYEEDGNAQQTTKKDNIMVKPVPQKKLVTEESSLNILPYTTGVC